MSIELGKLCSVILHQHFGEIAKIVGDDLFKSQAKSLLAIVKSTNLTKLEVTAALAIFLKFRLVTFKASATNENVAEYTLSKDNVKLILRYPRFVHLIQTKFGHESAAVVEELLRAGYQTASQTIVKSAANSDNKDIKASLQEQREKFTNLVKTNYLIRCPTSGKAASAIEVKNLYVPMMTVNEDLQFFLPEINVKDLISLQEGKPTTASDDGIFWMVNFERFHQDFRDMIMISAIERKLDANAGECFKFMLEIMYLKTHAWQVNSNLIPFVEIRQLCEKKSNNLDLIRYLDQYISVIENDSTKFICKNGEMGGGQYIIQMRIAFEQLTWACIENIIIEKFGSKAARIFRVVRLKKFIEQEDIQKEAMMPSKEAKMLTYKLLEEHFLQIRTIRKAGGGGAGPAKSFYLFYVNQNQIVNMLQEICYKALYNSITRSSYDKSVNKRLIEKSQRLESIVEAMKERGESEEYIEEILETLTPPEKEILQKIKLRVKNLYSAEIGLDETLFIFHFYQFFQHAK